MKPFDVIADSLAPDSPNSCLLRLRAAITNYLSAANLPRSHDDIEEVCSQLRLKALEHADQWTPSVPLEGWLMKMAFNLVREAKNKANRQRTIPVSQLSFDSAEDDARSQIEFFDSMKAQANTSNVAVHRKPAELPLPTLETLLPSLSTNSQQLLRMSITEGWEIPQIATQLGKSRGAIDTGLCRARAQLHKAYLAWKRELETFEDAPRSRNTRVAASSGAQLTGGTFSDES